MPDLTTYDLILVNTSGGKDSSVAAHVVSRLAEEAGVKDRVVLVHATFAEEWAGTVEIVKEQAAQLGLPLEIVSRKDGAEGLLDYVERRGRWPSAQQRYCTSDFKRAPIDRVITRRAPGVFRHGMQVLGLERPMRVLNIMGIRAEESPARAKRQAFRRDERRSNGRRIVDEWLPIFEMKVAEVWALIRKHEIPQHAAYALGMPRLSCVFCIFAPKGALVLAGKHNRSLLERYVEVERKIGHSFRENMKIAEVLEAVDAADEAAPVSDWKM